MKIKFDMIPDPVQRAKLESFDFDPDVAQQLALELIRLAGTESDLGSTHIELEYDPSDGKKVVGYNITGLPVRASKPGQA